MLDSLICQHICIFKLFATFFCLPLNSSSLMRPLLICIHNRLHVDKKKYEISDYLVKETNNVFGDVFGDRFLAKGMLITGNLCRGENNKIATLEVDYYFMLVIQST